MPDGGKFHTPSPTECLLGVSAKTCPGCHTAIDADAPFCAQCGAPMATQVIGETMQSGEAGEPGSLSYELEPERLQRGESSSLQARTRLAMPAISLACTRRHTKVATRSMLKSRLRRQCHGCA